MSSLKPNAIYDIYEGEYPVHIDQMTDPKPLAIIARASWQQISGRYRAEDKKAVEYSQQCKDAGIPFGLYHFLTPNGVAEQAALFLSVWNKCGASLPPIVDVEIDLSKSYGNSVTHGTWQGHVKQFLDLVSAGTGRTPMIYTSAFLWSFVTTRNLALQAVPPVWTANYPLWVAQYPYNPDSQEKPAGLPLGWKEWAIWQYCDKGRTLGYLANDLNTVSDWYLSELNNAGEPPIETGDAIASVTVTYKSGKTTTL